MIDINSAWHRASARYMLAVAAVTVADHILQARKFGINDLSKSTQLGTGFKCVSYL